MNPNSGTGYSWTNTSQWSQLPTVPVDPNQTQVPAGQQPVSQTQPSGSYSQPNQNYSVTPGYPVETRRDMITRLYKRILGREPDNAGLNYYLFNTQIPEMQIAREMYESTEHKDILARSKDVREMVLKLEENNKKLSEIETKLGNAESLVQNYKILIDQKTQIINSLKGKLNEADQESMNMPPQTQDDISQTQNPEQMSQSSFEESMVLDDPFADDYKPKGKGCMGSIKKWLSFSE